MRNHAIEVLVIEWRLLCCSICRHDMMSQFMVEEMGTHRAKEFEARDIEYYVYAFTEY